MGAVDGLAVVDVVGAAGEGTVDVVGAATEGAVVPALDPQAATIIARTIAVMDRHAMAEVYGLVAPGRRHPTKVSTSVMNWGDRFGGHLSA